MRKERAAGGGGAAECAAVCMSSEGFQPSHTIGGGKCDNRPFDPGQASRRGGMQPCQC